MPETFAIVPAGVKPFWIFVPVVLILGGVLAPGTATRSCSAPRSRASSSSG